MELAATKVCRFCTEEILEKALKCKHCGSFLADEAAESPTAPAATTVPVAAPSNQLVWLLAFSPLLSALVVAGLEGATGSRGAFAAVPAVISIGLCTLDERALKASGVNTEAFGASWLVPAYLSKRAEALGQSKDYLWVWLALFILSFFL